MSLKALQCLPVLMQLVQKFTVPVSHICTMSLLQVTVSHTASIQCQLLYQCHTGLAIETLVNHLGDNVADEVFVNTGDGMPAIPASANSVPAS